MSTKLPGSGLLPHQQQAQLYQLGMSRQTGKSAALATMYGSGKPNIVLPRLEKYMQDADFTSWYAPFAICYRTRYLPKVVLLHNVRGDVFRRQAYNDIATLIITAFQLTHVDNLVDLLAEMYERLSRKRSIETFMDPL